LPDALILVLNYAGNDLRIVYRFVAYVVYYDLPDPDDEEEEARRGSELNADIEENPDAFATSFEQLLFGRVLDEPRPLRDDLEVGSHRKLGGILLAWAVVDVIRLGQAPPKEIASNEEIVALVMGVTDGGHLLGLERLVAPRYRPDWQAAARQVRAVLADDSPWREGAATFLEVVAQEMPLANVSIAIHVVDNLLFAMAERAEFPDHAALPDFEITAADERERRALYGVLMWDGESWPETAERLLTAFTAKHPEFFGIRCFGRSARDYTAERLALHGLHRGLVEYRSEGVEVSATTVVPNDAGGLDVRDLADPGRHWDDWFGMHADYFQQLVVALRTRVNQI
jgi:hypothetical protein